MSKSKGTVWLDCDGVLLDYSTAFMDFTMKNYKLGVPATELTEYNLDKYFSSHKQMFDIMREFGESAEFSQLSPLVFSTVLDSVVNAGFELKVITYMPPTNSVEMKLSRLKNLSDKYGSVFDDVVFLSLDEKQSKIKYILDNSSAPAALVEDHPGIILEAVNTIKDGVNHFQIFAVQHGYNATMLRTHQLAYVERSQHASKAVVNCLKWMLLNS